MKGLLRLAWRHLVFHRSRTLLLATATLLAAFLPIAVEGIVTLYGERLRARAAATPLLLGAKGSRYDLAITSLYFRGRVPDSVPNSRVSEVQDSGLALAIPLAIGRTAEGHPLVGTSLDYFDFRGLRFQSGGPPAILGEAVLGARVARELKKRVGDSILSDRGNVYDLALAYPLRMRVVGILDETHDADDSAVFVDVRTAWIVDGIGHGHDDRETASPDTLLATEEGNEEGNVRFNAALVEYVEITEANVASFHFHGDQKDFPLTAVLCVPPTAKSATLLKGRYRLDGTAQLLEPTEAIEEILGFVFQLKRFFDLNVALVGVATLLFLVLVVTLSLRVRERELSTLRKIGGSRLSVATMLGLELLITLGAGLVVAGIAARFATHAFADLVLSL